MDATNTGPGGPRAVLAAAVTAILVASLGACSKSADTSGSDGGSTGTTATSSWTGTTEAPGATSISVRLDLQEGPSGFSGTVSVLFPGATDYFQADSLTGTRTGDALHLVGTSGLIIDATESGNSLTGTVTFPIDGGPNSAQLQASRS